MEEIPQVDCSNHYSKPTEETEGWVDLAYGEFETFEASPNSIFLLQTIFLQNLPHLQLIRVKVFSRMLPSIETNGKEMPLVQELNSCLFQVIVQKYYLQ